MVATLADQYFINYIVRLGGKVAQGSLPPNIIHDVSATVLLHVINKRLSPPIKYVTAGYFDYGSEPAWCDTEGREIEYAGVMVYAWSYLPKPAPYGEE